MLYVSRSYQLPSLQRTRHTTVMGFHLPHPGSPLGIASRMHRLSDTRLAVSLKGYVAMRQAPMQEPVVSLHLLVSGMNSIGNLSYHPTFNPCL